MKNFFTSILFLLLVGFLFCPVKSIGADKVRTLGVFLYPGFELLDACGPAEMFGNLKPRIKMIMVGKKAGPIESAQGTKVVADFGMDDCPQLDLILIPGGEGTLQQLQDEAVIAWIGQRSKMAEITMSVCSGSAILAKAGLLDNRPATTNKEFYTMITGLAPNVKWVRQARWVDDGKIVTSSGVSAGMDMALHVIQRLFGAETAERLAQGTEYTWHRKADEDPFSKNIK